MRNSIKTMSCISLVLLLTVLPAFSKTDTPEYHACDDVAPGSPLEVRIEYRDGTARSLRGLRCAGAVLAAYRSKYVKVIWVREHGSGKLLDAHKAFWVVSPRYGSIEAFSKRPEAAAFSREHGGRVANFGDMMAGLFSGMYGEIRKSSLVNSDGVKDDMAAYPKCAYCGMDRSQYSYSRVLLTYSDGSQVGLCSVHCAGLDLALHPEKMPARIMVGTYDNGKLIDAGKAVWVLGGAKHGVMSVRGKWAFERKSDADAFMREFGGSITDFHDVMTAVFEDMWEIIR